MDGPLGPVEPEEPDELERLRRRAYGRGADIAGDAAAQARLTELEAAQHPPQTPVVDAVESVPAPVEERLPGPAPAEAPVTERDPAEESNAGSDAVDRAPATRRHRWWAIIGIAIADVVLIAALLTWVWPRAPDDLASPDRGPSPDFGESADFVLALESVGADADEPKDPHGTLDRLGLDVDEMRRYQDIGYLSVWSGDSRDGTACLLVAHPGQGLNEGIGTEVCDDEGAHIVADLSMPNGSRIRFVLKDDHVDVYMNRRIVDPAAPQG